MSLKRLDSFREWRQLFWNVLQVCYKLLLFKVAAKLGSENECLLYKNCTLEILG